MPDWIGRLASIAAIAAAGALLTGFVAGPGFAALFLFVFLVAAVAIGLRARSRLAKWLAESLVFSLVAVAAAEPAAQVGSRTVTWAQVERRLEQARAAGASADPAAVLEALVDEAALAQECERLGLARSPPVVARVEAARRRAAAERFLEEEVYPGARPDQATPLAMYHDRADSVRLQLLILASRQEAEAAVTRLKAGVPFAEEASRSLEPDSASRRGDMGRKSRGELNPAVAEPAFRATPGEITGPVQLDLGWAVLRVQERTIGDEKGFDERRSVINDDFCLSNVGNRFRGIKDPANWFDSLGRRALAKFDDEQLQGFR